MPFDTQLNNDERELLLALIHESLRVQSHFELFLWLQGKLQVFLPHEIMIAAWGDFSLGLVYFDIVSSLPGLRTKGISQNELTPLLKRLFSFWCNHNQSSFTITIDQGLFKNDELEYSIPNEALGNMTSAMVHGIQDCRGHHDCLYVLMTSNPQPASSHKMLEALLPYIDCALRQLDHFPEQLPSTPPPPVIEIPEELSDIDTALSLRETEIMGWVKQGKTNAEIGIILDISPFTVKNHLQRIFKKLDVLNRAQAVSSYK